jgi:hypothetical protein
MFDLRSWMRRAPKPKKLRIKNPDGEWRVIELSGGRYLWNEVEQTVKTAEAVAIECLDADGNVLRAKKLVDDDGESFEGDGKDEGAKSLSKAMREQAAMLDAYGRRLNEAFARGAEAASTSQDKLVSLVENLTEHLTIALTNVHTLSTNYANALASAPEEGSNGAQTLLGLVAAMTGKLPAAPTTPPNGTKK